MRAIIFSDSHKQFNSMMEAIERFGPVDMIIHAGDVQRDVEDLEIMYPKTPVVSVKGNNESYFCDVAEDRFFEFDGVKIFLTHGHNYGVKYSTAKLFKYAEKLGAQLCIFGHTHKKMKEHIGDVVMFNPGSASRSCGILETYENGFSVEFLDT